MRTTKLRKVGGSVMVTLSPSILEQLHLRAGDPVGLVVEHGRAVLEPKVKPRYTLKQLLTECKPRAKRSEEDRAWLESAPTGRELL